jgi:hypothetical protein
MATTVEGAQAFFLSHLPITNWACRPLCKVSQLFLLQDNLRSTLFLSVALQEISPYSQVKC